METETSVEIFQEQEYPRHYTSHPPLSNGSFGYGPVISTALTAIKFADEPPKPTTFNKQFTAGLGTLCSKVTP